MAASPLLTRLQAWNGRVRWRVARVLLYSIVIGVGAGEALGWPVLRGPIEQALSATLGRAVSLHTVDDPGSAFSVRLLGRIRIAAASISIGGPDWATSADTLTARDVRLVLSYADLWRAQAGQALHVRELSAAQLRLDLIRLDDGRATWQFGSGSKQSPAARNGEQRMPSFDHLEVGSGAVHYDDAPQHLQLVAQLRLTDGMQAVAPASRAARVARARGLVATATGRYRDDPLVIEMSAAEVLPWILARHTGRGVPVDIRATAGRAHLVFSGTVASALALDGLLGRFDLRGPSLAAVGDPLRIPLPATGAFHASGRVGKQGSVWSVAADQGTVGTSRLGGVFTYDRSLPKPLLAGRLAGSRLVLADLAQAVGAAAPEAAPQAGSRLLPAREFDLPSLRAMDANVSIDIDHLDLGTAFSAPLQQFKGHLVLQGGRLALNDLQARTGRGRIHGDISLNGSGPSALWRASLHWRNVRLEHWLRQTRDPQQPPYISGEINGHAIVSGTGRSTAQILATLNGSGRIDLQQGAISHLRLAEAGIDVAKMLSLYLTGDNTVPMDCAVADLEADRGVVHPKLAMVVTRDASAMVTGSLSLADETLDLRLVVAPRHFSLATLRTPIQLRGSFAAPAWALERGPLARRVAYAAALAAAAPAAALLPLLDPGDAEKAQQMADDCRRAGRH